MVNALATMLSFVLLRELLRHIPKKTTVKRVDKTGIINQKISPQAQAKLSLNNTLNFKENNEVVQKFINAMQQNFPHCDLTSFYNNINSLKVESHNGYIITGNEKRVGEYDAATNIVKLANLKNTSTAASEHIKYHELLHMASSRSDKQRGLSFTGFKKSVGNNEIGRGLNEGYTEHLTTTYFSGRVENTYNEQKVIATGIEMIVGRQNMQRMYFTNDLEGLISTLSKYTTKEKAQAIVEETDYLSNMPKEQKEQSSRNIRKEISKALVEKTKSDYKAGKINQTQYKMTLLDARLYIEGSFIERIRDKNNPSYVTYKTHPLPYASVGPTVSGKQTFEQTADYLYQMHINNPDAYLDNFEIPKTLHPNYIAKEQVKQMYFARPQQVEQQPKKHQSKNQLSSDPAELKRMLSNYGERVATEARQR